ncbi:MAG: APC family permease [Candidatus Bathyarchaeia archaeon]
MAEVFLRKATGLVREAGLLDVLSLFVMWGGPTMGLYYLTTWGSWTAPRGDWYIGILITAVFLLGGGLCWAFMASTMPRSGGDYVYTSRIIHPAVGFAFSVGSVVGMLGWYYMLAAWVPEYALPTLLEAMGHPEFTEILWRPEVSFAISSIVMAICMVIGLFRAKWVYKAMDVCFILATISMVAALGVLASVGREGFARTFNAIAIGCGSPLRYENMIEFANNYATEAYGYSIIGPITFRQTLVLIPAIWWTFAYMAGPAWVAGEVKEVRRNMLAGYLLGITFYVGSFLIGSAVIDSVIGREWMAAASYAMETPEWQNYLPISEASYVLFAAMATDNSVLKFLIGLNYLPVCFAWVLQSAAITPRALVAWAMDRVVPSWLGDIHPRWRTPHKAIITFWIIAELCMIGYLLLPGILAALYVIVWENCTSFLAVALCCLLLPYLKKARHIWEASPVNWRIGRIPVMLITGVIYLVAIFTTTYLFLAHPELGEYHPPSWIGLSIIAIIGLVGWYVARWHRKKTMGIDIAEAFREIPPA